MNRGLFGFVLMLAMSLSGCGAVYHYERTEDRCRLAIYSSRDVHAADLEIDKNCVVHGGAGSLAGSDKALNVLSKLLKIIP